MNIPEKNIERFKQYLESRGVELIDPPPDDKVIRTPCRRPTIPALQGSEKGTLQQKFIKETNESIISGSDKRERVEKTSEWPYSVHGVIAVDINETLHWGTGILVGPNIVLTAGHNLYSHKEKAYANLERMQFLPAVNGQRLPFSYVEVEQYFVSPNYIKEQKEDYGILVLKEPLGEKTGYFGLSCLEPEELRGKVVNVTGYPNEKAASKQNNYEMWTGRGQVQSLDLENGEIFYFIDTGSDQSGSGVFYQEGEDYYVCGIHVLGRTFLKRATFLTRSIYRQIYQWTHETRDKKSLKQFDKRKELKFRNWQIDAGCLSLLANYHLDKLTMLDLRSKKMGSTEAKVLAQINSWINLSVLDLGDNKIGNEGAQFLGQNISGINLSQLNLNRNMIDDEGAKGLAQNKSWVSLSKLNLSDNRICDEGAKALGQSNSWINLSVLDLGDNKIGNEGAQFLGQNTSWINLSQLNLNRNMIDDEGAKGLAQNKSWVKLLQLNLDGNEIGDEGTKALRQNNSWTNLSHLSSDKTKKSSVYQPFIKQKKKDFKVLPSIIDHQETPKTSTMNLPELNFEGWPSPRRERYPKYPGDIVLRKEEDFIRSYFSFSSLFQHISTNDNIQLMDHAFSQHSLLSRPELESFWIWKIEQKQKRLGSELLKQNDKLIQPLHTLQPLKGNVIEEFEAKAEEQNLRIPKIFQELSCEETSAQEQLLRINRDSQKSENEEV